MEVRREDMEAVGVTGKMWKTEGGGGGETGSTKGEAVRYGKLEI